ncbi:hypothetical protein LAT59_02015 [Candidatus Gracilibacteria bacterium]|nr:hypothetical protein [Candidatus Gracilibacteria bacterium]
MTKKQSIQVFTILGLIILSSIGAYGFYMYTQGGGLIQDNYKDNLTFEEVEQKIISYQKKGYKALRESIEENIEKISEVYHLGGSTSINGKAESPFLGSMSFDISADDYSLQVVENTFDFQIQKLLMNYILSPLNMTGEESISMNINSEKLHIALSEEGLFAGAQKLNLDIPFLENSYKEAIEYFIGEGKYLDFGVDISDITEANEFSEITDIVSEMDEIFLESLGVFLENESLFEVVGQEETKYYLRPSLAACSLAKGIFGNIGIYQANMFAEMFGSEKKDYIKVYTENGFHSDIEECSSEEYEEIATEIFSQLDSEIRLFIEIANFKTHLGIEVQEENMGTMTAGSVIGASGIQESYLTVNFTGEEILGEGIELIYTQEQGLLGTVDLRDREDIMSIFMKIEPAEQENTRDIKIEISAKEDFTQSYIKIDFVGNMQKNRLEMNGEINGGIMGVEANNILTVMSQATDSASEFTFDMDTRVKVEPGSPEVEAKTEIRVNQNSEDGKKYTTSHIKVRAPNMFHFELNMEDHFELTNDIVREITTPEETFTLKELEHRVRINKMRNRARGIDEVEMDLGIIIPALGAYSQDAINAKVVSDTRTIVSGIEVYFTKGGSFEEVLGNIGHDYSTENAIHKVGYINYNMLGFNKIDFESDKTQAYKLAVYVTEIDGQMHRTYQVMGVTLENGQEIARIRGNHISYDGFPEGLFKHPITNQYLKNGDIIQ